MYSINVGSPYPKAFANLLFKIIILDLKNKNEVCLALNNLMCHCVKCITI